MENSKLFFLKPELSSTKEPLFLTIFFADLISGLLEPSTSEFSLEAFLVLTYYILI